MFGCRVRVVVVALGIFPLGALGCGASASDGTQDRSVPDRSVPDRSVPDRSVPDRSVPEPEATQPGATQPSSEEPPQGDRGDVVLTEPVGGAQPLPPTHLVVPPDEERAAREQAERERLQLEEAVERSMSDCATLWEVADVASGVERCSESLYAVDLTADCAKLGLGVVAFTEDGRSACETDADCPPSAQCEGLPSGRCRYPADCQSNNDCGDGAACFCSYDEASDPVGHRLNRCLPADCVGDADCGQYRCGVSKPLCLGLEGSFCHGPDDECQTSADCDRGYCRYHDAESAGLARAGTLAGSRLLSRRAS